MINQIIIKKVIAADSTDIWLWRNDHATRAMSVTTAKIPWDLHLQWFEKSLSNRNRCLYIGVLKEDQSKVGMCRFDIDHQRDIAEVSLNLNPEKRGQNLSGAFLSEAIRVFLKEQNLNLIATIKRSNIPSIKCFTKCGFLLLRQDESWGHYFLNKNGPPSSQPAGNLTKGRTSF